MLRQLLGRRCLGRLVHPQPFNFFESLRVYISSTAAHCSSDRFGDQDPDGSTIWASTSKGFRKISLPKVSEQAYDEFAEEFEKEMAGLDLGNLEIEDFEDLEQRLNKLDWTKIGLHDDSQLGPDLDEVLLDEELAEALEKTLDEEFGNVSGDDSSDDEDVEDDDIYEDRFEDSESPRRRGDQSDDEDDDNAESFEDEEVTHYVNLAGSNRPGWHIVDTDEDNLITWWGVDFTGGQIPSIERNALLSDEAKNKMYSMHKENPEEMTVEYLADLFRIRQQRVMAILALKELEEKAVLDGEETFDELQDLMENEVWDCVWEQGTGEHHVRNLPSRPNFEVRDIPEGSDLEPGDLISEIDEVQERLAEREERILVKEFKDRLDWNLGKTGKSISRESRSKHAPKRPPEGWSMVVKPLGGGKPYVAKPDGSKRELTEDEQLYIERMKPKPRRKIL